MSLGDFLSILLGCSALMFVCRVVPLMALKGHSLSPTITRALEFIPPAAFTALVVNDLFQPDAFAAGGWEWAIPLVAAAAVGAVGVKTKSIVWCVVVGVGSFAALSAVAGTL